MGGIMAPVEGSGDWPAWMVRVVKPRRFFIEELMGKPVRKISTV
jgi:hypothetical protein